MMKRLVFMVMTLVMVTVSSWAQTLNIGGHRAPIDNLNHIWLCSVPQSIFGTDYEAVVTFGDELTDVVIDGVAVASGDTFRFEGISGSKQYMVTAQMGGETITGGITFTWLPVVELNGDFNDTYQVGTVTVSEPDSAYAEPLSARLKWRGQATNTESSHKRNYRIKFINEEDGSKANHRFFGLRNDNNWILDAGQRDFLRLRNRISTDLWLDYARQPWYAEADSIKNVRNGSRGQVVEVLLNGEYQGIYNMCEPIDRKQLKLERYAETEDGYDMHGMLWTSFKWTRTVTMSRPEPLPADSPIWDGFELKYPDYDETHMADWTVLHNAVWFSNRADLDFEARVDSMAYYYDIPVLQDYHIFILLLQALDNESKNIYYACHDVQEHPRLTMVPWDLDICLGQNYAPGVDQPNIVSPERPTGGWIMNLPMCDMFEIEEYRHSMTERYWELRQTVFDPDSLVNRFRTVMDGLEACGAASREEARWSHDSDIANKTLDLSNEMDYVEDWIRRRVAYLDTHLFAVVAGDVNADGEVNIADVNTVIDIILGVEYDEYTMERADVNSDGEVNIADVNALIDIILKQS